MLKCLCMDTPSDINDSKPTKFDKNNDCNDLKTNEYRHHPTRSTSSSLSVITNHSISTDSISCPSSISSSTISKSSSHSKRFMYDLRADNYLNHKNLNIKSNKRLRPPPKHKYNRIKSVESVQKRDDHQIINDHIKYNNNNINISNHQNEYNYFGVAVNVISIDCDCDCCPNGTQYVIHNADIMDIDNIYNPDFVHFNINDNSINHGLSVIDE